MNSFNDLPFDLHMKIFNIVKTNKEKDVNCKEYTRFESDCGDAFPLMRISMKVTKCVFKYHTVYYKKGDLAYFNKNDQCEIKFMRDDYIKFENNKCLTPFKFYEVNKFDEFETPDCWERVERKYFFCYQKKV
jgi:hypothetical protein